MDLYTVKAFSLERKQCSNIVTGKYKYIFVVTVNSHIHRIVLATEETTVTQQVTVSY